MELAHKWSFATIGNLIGEDGIFIDGDWVETKDQDPNGEIRLIQLADIGDGYYRNRSNRFLTYKKALELGCTFLKEGDVLIARMPDPLGRACIFPGDSKTSVTVVDVCIVRTGEAGTNNRWLMCAINSPQFRAMVEGLQSGSTRKRISRSNLAKIQLPVPPLPEQNRIVARIESLFTQLDAGVTALKRVQAALKRYRASVLKSACEGRLVPQDPNDEPADELLKRILLEKGEKVENIPTLNGNLPELPKWWVWAVLEQLAWDSDYGTSQKCDYGTSEIPVLRIPNIVNGNINYYDLKYATKPDDLHTKKSLALNDMLIIRTNGSRDLIGRCAVVRQPLEKLTFFASYLIRFRLINCGPWISTIWNSPDNRDRIERIAATSAGQYNVNINSLNKHIIPLPPQLEQQRIVAEVDRCLSVVQELDQTVTASLKRAARLRQAILKRAFEGKLAPQNPQNEPVGAPLVGALPALGAQSDLTES